MPKLKDRLWYWPLSLVCPVVDRRSEEGSPNDSFRARASEVHGANRSTSTWSWMSPFEDTWEGEGFAPNYDHPTHGLMEVAYHTQATDGEDMLGGTEFGGIQGLGQGRFADFLRSDSICDYK